MHEEFHVSTSATDAGALRSALKRQSNYLVNRLKARTHEGHEAINVRLAKETGALLGAASIDQLKVRILLLQQWLRA